MYDLFYGSLKKSDWKKVRSEQKEVRKPVSLAASFSESQEKQIKSYKTIMSFFFGASVTIATLVLAFGVIFRYSAPDILIPVVMSLLFGIASLLLCSFLIRALKHNMDFQGETYVLTISEIHEEFLRINTLDVARFVVDMNGVKFIMEENLEMAQRIKCGQSVFATITVSKQFFDAAADDDLLAASIAIERKVTV